MIFVVAPIAPARTARRSRAAPPGRGAARQVQVRTLVATLVGSTKIRRSLPAPDLEPFKLTVAAKGAAGAGACAAGGLVSATATRRSRRGQRRARETVARGNGDETNINILNIAVDVRTGYPIECERMTKYKFIGEMCFFFFFFFFFLVCFFFFFFY
jgi:hypothetical protein